MTVTQQIPTGIAFQLPDGGMTDDQFAAFCHLNPDLRIERTCDQQIIIQAPAASDTGNKNFNLTVALGIWNMKYKLGKGFDSSTSFKLPSGADYSPDLAWIRNERWDALPEEQKGKFAPIAPDFVLELRSFDQSLTYLKSKMEDYIAAGCQLGWLIDVQNRKTYVYEANGDIQTMAFETPLTGDDVLPGFSVRLSEILG